MCFEDGSGLAFEARELSVVLRQCVGLSADRVPPIGYRQENTQKQCLVSAESSELSFEVDLGRLASFSKHKILFARLRYVANAEGHRVDDIVHPLIEVRSIASN